MERDRYTPADRAEVQDSPGWTEEDIRRARRGRDVLPSGFLAKPRGRPPAEGNKEAVSIRLDRDVIDAFKGDGAGWQTRMNDALRKAARLPAEAR